MNALVPVQRPKFAQWRYDRALNLRATAELIRTAAEKAGITVRCSYEQVRTLCLPFGHPDRTEPKPDVAFAIELLTEQAIVAADFSDVRSAA